MILIAQDNIYQSCNKLSKHKDWSRPMPPQWNDLITTVRKTVGDIDTQKIKKEANLWWPIIIQRLRPAFDMKICNHFTWLWLRLYQKYTPDSRFFRQLLVNKNRTAFSYIFIHPTLPSGGLANSVASVS